MKCMKNIMNCLEKNTDWIANAYQSLIAAIALWEGMFLVLPTVFAFPKNLGVLWLVLLLVAIVLVPLLFSLFGNAVLVALQGLEVIKKEDGFDKIGKLGTGLQLIISMMPIVVVVVLYLAILFPSCGESFDYSLLVHLISIVLVLLFVPILLVTKVWHDKKVKC